MVIDIHAHLIPASVYKELSENPERYPGVKLMRAGDRYQMQIGNAPPTRPILPLLSDVDQRRSFMAERGIDYQLLGGWLDIFGYDLPVPVGARWSQLLNDHLAAALAAEPQRFGALATVPLQDGEAAAKEVERTRRLGFKGVLIGTVAGTKELDDPSLLPFWSAAAELGMPVMIHPMFAGEDPRLARYSLPNIIGRPYDTVIAAASLIFGGVLDRLPDLKVVLVHGGGYLPYQVGRLDHGFNAEAPARAKGGKLPSELIRTMYYDHVVFHPLALRYLVDLVGADHVLLGTDYPFPVGDLRPLRIMDETPFTAGERALIQTDAARAIFNI